MIDWTIDLLAVRQDYFPLTHICSTPCICLEMARTLIGSILKPCLCFYFLHQSEDAEVSDDGPTDTCTRPPRLCCCSQPHLYVPRLSEANCAAGCPGYRWSALTVFSFFLSNTAVSAESLHQSEVRRRAGAHVELECVFPSNSRMDVTSASLHVVEWVRQGLDVPVLIKFGSYPPRVHPEYEGKRSSLTVALLIVDELWWILSTLWRHVYVFNFGHL